MKAHLLLTHGAGASCQSDFMQQLAIALRAEQIKVTLFNFSYMQARFTSLTKRPPPKAILLVPELTQALAELTTDLPLFIGGKSMGSRVASLWAAQRGQELSSVENSNERQIRAVFAYGYPFHPPRKDSWRTEHFDALKIPLHIMQGERDPFGSKPEFADYKELQQMTWPNVTVNWLPTADHDFKPLKSSGLTQAALIQQAAKLTSRYIDAVITKSE